MEMDSKYFYKTNTKQILLIQILKYIVDMGYGSGIQIL